MSEDVKMKIHQMIDTITNKSLLQMVSDDITCYFQQEVIVDEMNHSQAEELEAAISEADHDQTIPWDNFKKEKEDWKKK